MTLCAMASTLLLVLTLQLHDHGLRPAAAEIVFARGDFPSGLLKKVNAKKIVSVVRDNYDTTRFDVAPAKIEDYPWYTLVDFAKSPRFADVGVLFTCVDEELCIPVTAFYVGDDLLMCAGHSIANSGNERPAEQLSIFFPGLDGKKLAKLKDKEIVKRARIVTSWWVPLDYYGDTSQKCGRTTKGHDFAFLRVHKPKEDHGQNKFYNLTPPDEFISQQIKVLEVGYPVDVPDVLRPVMVETTLHAPDDEEVKSVNPPIPADAITTMKGSQVVLIARNRGVSLGGASGSPLFPSPSAANGATKSLSNSVIGVHSWSEKCKTKKSDPASVKLEAFVSPLINAEIVLSRIRFAWVQRAKRRSSL